MTVQIGGQIGPFLDSVQNRQVPVMVMGTCDYATNGPAPDPAQLDAQVRAQILSTIRDVIGRKMETRQLTFRHLGTGDIAAVIPEIVAASGLAPMGIHITNLAMQFGIDGHAPQPAQGNAQGNPGAGPQHNLSQGTFDMGGGHQLQVQINGKTPENYLKDKASGMIWGWIIGAVIIGVMVLVAVGFGIYIYVTAKDGGATASAASAKAAKWDGKSTFECGGNDVVALTGVKATAGVKAGANCQLTLSGVDITAPVAIDASGNAKVKVAGGSLSGSTNAVVASANAKVDLVGTKVSGKSQASGGAKITGP